MTTLVLSILNGSFSFLHTIRTTFKAWMSLNFVMIPSHNVVGTQKNRVNETVLLSTQNIC